MEVNNVDLKNNKITVGELLDNPHARTVLQRRFPVVMRHPLLGASRTVTLEQIVSFAETYVSKKVVDETMEELKKL
jgi:hypothetical protein